MKQIDHNLKIVFFGSPPFGTPVLKKLEKKFEVVKSINKPEQLSNETIEQLRILNPDLFVVASFGKIIKRDLLSIPRLGTINIHPSLLPKYRGASPIQTAILNGDQKTGISFIKMDEEIDHGPILEQIEEAILDTDTFESLSIRLFRKASELIIGVITRYNEIEPKPQDESSNSVTKRLTRSDGYIDISDNKSFKNENLKMKIRAYHPWPGVWTHFRLSSSGQAKIIKLLPNQQLQVEGKGPMSYKDFMNGYEKGGEFLKRLDLT